MRDTFSLVFLLSLVGFACVAADFKDLEFSRGDVRVRFAAQGAAVTEVSVGGVRYDIGEKSFVDKLIQPKSDDLEYRETFDRTDFCVENCEERNGHPSLTFVGESTGFPGVSIRKTYDLVEDEGLQALEVRVRATNGSRERRTFAHSSKLLLLPGKGPVRLMMPQTDGSHRTIAYPSGEASDNAVIRPKRRDFGVCGEDGKGFVFAAPRYMVGGFYSYLSQDGGRLATEEYYSTVTNLAPGASVTWKLRMIFTPDVIGHLAGRRLSADAANGEPCAHLRIFDRPPKKIRTVDVGGLSPDDCRTPEDRLVKGFKIPLDLLKTIRPTDIGYHVDWFFPGEPIDMLYLLQPGDNIIANGKNFINELTARLPAKVTYRPLLPEVLGIRGRKPYSVYSTFFGECLDEWTMEEMRKIRDLAPKVVVVQKLDFKIAQKEFLDILSGYASRGAGLVFVDCGNVPDSLLGVVADKWDDRCVMLLPQMSNRRGRFVKMCRRADGAASNALVASPYSQRRLRDFQVLPDNADCERNPVVHSREFPWHDYAFLALAKAVRLASGIQMPSRIIDAKDGRVILRTSVPGSYRMVRTFKDTYRFTDAVVTNVLEAKSGDRRFDLSTPDLPGGVHVCELKLLDDAGNVIDAAAFRFDTETKHPIALAFADTNRIFAADRPVEFAVVLKTQVPADAKIIAELEDSDFRVIRRTEIPAVDGARFSFAQAANPLLLERVIVRLVSGGRTLTRAVEEVSVRMRPKDRTDTLAYITVSPSAPPGAPLLRDLGFDFAIAGFQNAGNGETIRQYANLGICTIPRNCAAGPDWFRPYRGDNPRGNPSRTPCFSSESYRQELETRIRKQAMRNRYDFYNVRYHWLGDECFLGSTVCYSPTCLRDFRAAMAAKYGDIAKLNARWRMSFASFDEVMPCQLDALASKDCLAPWLEHKMFMAKQFADKWVGGAKGVLDEVSPGSCIGPTGTAVPGYGWDWSQMMKYIDAIGYYGGAQRKLIHDFAALYGREIMAGQCGGGYTHAAPDFEPYNYDTMWSGLLKGSNLAYHYFGAAIDGDYTATSNMLYWAASMEELKSGIGKMWLAGRARPRVAVLYSQASLFAAMATCGKQVWQDSLTSWWRILSDLKIDFVFYPYECLAGKGVPKDCRVFILPAALALSEDERKALSDFAVKGGTVLADLEPGVRDEAGVLMSARLPFAKILGDDLVRYNSVDLGGAAGETASESVAEGAFARNARLRVKAALSAADVHAQVTVVDSQGEEYACDAPWRADGENWIFAMHVDTRGNDNNGSGRDGGTGIGRFHLEDGESVVAHLPVRGHVYDVRARTYIGFTDTIKTKISPGYTRMYSILAKRPGALMVTGPSKIRAGEPARFAFELADSVGPQVFHCRVVDPDGKAAWRFRRNLRTVEGGGEHVFESAFNERPGLWKLIVRHVNTGVETVKMFEVGK